MVGSQFAHAVAGGFDRLLRPARHPMLLLLEDAPVTVDDILDVPERIDDSTDDADVAGRGDLPRALTAGLDRLLRPDRHPLLLLLGDTPLTVADILATPQDPALRPD